MGRAFLTIFIRCAVENIVDKLLYFIIFYSMMPPKAAFSKCGAPSTTILPASGQTLLQSNHGGG
jgi:hypothetical protein